ncbi:MAG: thioesterase [Acidobacteria bacterium]|nr:thioesterase [Acidobacteriota bacterium]
MSMHSGTLTAAGARSKWLVWPRPNPTSSLRLFCFASAGHGPSMFRSWPVLVGPDVELGIIQLPGRESRWSEAPLSSLGALVPPLCDALAPHLDRRFAFFGHSLGALVAFETARHLRRTRNLSPALVFASAHRAPQLPNRHPRISDLPREEFVAAVNARHGGIPEAVSRNRELLDLMLPSLTADYRMFEDFRYVADAPLPCPIAALGGTEDVYVGRAELEPWAVQTGAAFTLHILAGGHFFVNDSREQVVSIVLDQLQRAGL